MQYLMLAQMDIDWIELIIILVVVGGSVFGAVAKKLITAFTPKDSQKPGTKIGRVDVTIPRPTPPAPRVHPSPPAARPTPPTSRPPVARPIPRPPTIVVPPFVEEVAEPVPPRRRPSARPVQTPRPAGKMGPAPRRGRPAPARAENRLGHLEPTVLEEEAQFESAAERRMTHLESAVPQAEERFEEAVEDRLGYAETEPARTRSRRRVPLIGRSSRRSLRRAILLREILGPPIALRPPDDR